MINIGHACHNSIEIEQILIYIGYFGGYGAGKANIMGIQAVIEIREGQMGARAAVKNSSVLDILLDQRRATYGKIVIKRGLCEGNFALIGVDNPIAIFGYIAIHINTLLDANIAVINYIATGNELCGCYIKGCRPAIVRY